MHKEKKWGGTDRGREGGGGGQQTGKKYGQEKDEPGGDIRKAELIARKDLKR